MKKFISLTAIAALAFGFAACSSEDDLTPQGQDPQAAAAGTGAYVQFTIDTNSSSLSATSRAETEVTATTNGYDVLESTGVYKEDLDIEHAVKTVYAYFVNASKDGSAYSVNKDSKLINLGTESAPVYYLELNAMKQLPNTDATELKTTTDTDGNTSQISTQYVTEVKQLTGDEIKLGNEYQVYLLCNKPADLTVKGAAITNPTLGDVLDDELELNKTTTNSDNSTTIDDASTTANITANGIPMAARSIDGVIYKAFTPTKTNTKDNPSKLSFEVERSFARIAYTAPETTAIPLYASVDNAENSKDQIGTIEVEGYYVFNRHNEYNTYRHVGSISGSDGSYSTTPYATIIEPASSSKVPGVYGPMNSNNTSCNFLIDPNSHLKKTGDYTKYNSALARITKYIKWEKAASWNEYVTENSMPTANQKKGLATGVMFKVKITPTANSVVCATGETYTAGQSLYYYDGVFYASIKALQTKLPEAKVSNFRNYNAKYYKNGKAYYSYYIRHINNGDYNVMGDMEFATVRNNSYELSITAAAMNAFETPVTDPTLEPDPKDPTNDDPDEDIPDPDPKNPDPDDPDDQNPSHPDPGEDVEDANSYLQVNVIVRPWIVRSNTVIFGQGF
jgi:hypothetical protein